MYRVRSAFFLACLCCSSSVLADGKLFYPRDYRGSLEESAQEAILIYEAEDNPEGGQQDLILKINVKGKVDRFAWVIPFPNVPKVEREDQEIFAELFRYVEQRRLERARATKGDSAAAPKANAGREVEVLSRQTVGSYEVAIVREETDGALNRWLDTEGFTSLGKDADPVIRHYREEGSVFACIKVSDTNLSAQGASELHPLRFTFRTGRAEGIYFPMRLTGLQDEPFSVNLHIFYRYWINDNLDEHGYVSQGFRLIHRDWDTRSCVANGGKNYAQPESDLYLLPYASRLTKTSALLGRLYPGQRFYLTTIQGTFYPRQVRERDDLWLYPYRTQRAQISGPVWAILGLSVGIATLAVGMWFGLRKQRLAAVRWWSRQRVRSES